MLEMILNSVGSQFSTWLQVEAPAQYSTVDQSCHEIHQELSDHPIVNSFLYAQATISIGMILIFLGEIHL